MNTAMLERKNTLHGINRRLEIVEEKTREIKDKYKLSKKNFFFFRKWNKCFMCRATSSSLIYM